MRRIQIWPLFCDLPSFFVIFQGKVVISFLFLKNVVKERERNFGQMRKKIKHAKLCKCAKNQCLICRISPKIPGSIFSKSYFIFFPEV